MSVSQVPTVIAQRINVQARMSNSKGVAIVTGCAQGIGKAIATRLASDGYDIALSDIPSKEGMLQGLQSEISGKFGRKAICVAADVSIEKDVEALIKETVDKLGGLDVVNMLFCRVSGKLSYHFIDGRKRRAVLSCHCYRVLEPFPL